MISKVAHRESESSPVAISSVWPGIISPILIAGASLDQLIYSFPIKSWSYPFAALLLFHHSGLQIGRHGTIKSEIKFRHVPYFVDKIGEVYYMYQYVSYHISYAICVITNPSSHISTADAPLPEQLRIKKRRHDRLGLHSHPFVVLDDHDPVFHLGTLGCYRLHGSGAYQGSLVLYSS